MLKSSIVLKLPTLWKVIHDAEISHSANINHSAKVICNTNYPVIHEAKAIHSTNFIHNAKVRFTNRDGQEMRILNKAPKVMPWVKLLTVGKEKPSDTNLAATLLFV